MKIGIVLFLVVTICLANNLVGYGSGPKDGSSSDLAFHGWTYDLETSEATVNENDDPSLEPTFVFYTTATSSCGNRVVYAMMYDQLISISQDDGSVLTNTTLSTSSVYLETCFLEYDELHSELLLVGLDYTDGFYKLYGVNPTSGDLSEKLVIVYSSSVYLNDFGPSTFDQGQSIMYFVGEQGTETILYSVDTNSLTVTNKTVSNAPSSTKVQLIQYDQNQDVLALLMNTPFVTEIKHSLLNTTTGLLTGITTVAESKVQSCELYSGGYDVSSSLWYFTCPAIGGYFSMNIDDPNTLVVTEPSAINSTVPDTYGVFFLDAECGGSDEDSIPQELIDYCEDQGITGYIGQNCTIAIDLVVDVEIIYNEDGELLVEEYETEVDNVVVTMIFPSNNPNGDGATYVIVTKVDPATNPNQVDPEETLPGGSEPAAEGTGFEISVDNVSSPAVPQSFGDEGQSVAFSAAAIGAGSVGLGVAYGLYEYIDDDDGKKRGTAQWVSTDDLCSDPDGTTYEVGPDGSVTVTTAICHFTQFQLVAISAQETTTLSFVPSTSLSTTSSTTSSAMKLNINLIHVSFAILFSWFLLFA